MKGRNSAKTCGKSEGFTEWTNVTGSVPLFYGHYQPRPAGGPGYYDLRMKETISRQMELARTYCIYGFCIYYYWFDGKTLLETPLRLIKENPGTGSAILPLPGQWKPDPQMGRTGT